MNQYSTAGDGARPVMYASTEPAQDADRTRLQRRGHTGIVALLGALDAARAAGPEGQDWVDVAYGAGTVRVSVAPAALQMA